MNFSIAKNFDYKLLNKKIKNIFKFEAGAGDAAAKMERPLEPAALLPVPSVQANSINICPKVDIPGRGDEGLPLLHAPEPERLLPSSRFIINRAHDNVLASQKRQVTMC